MWLTKDLLLTKHMCSFVFWNILERMVEVFLFEVSVKHNIVHKSYLTFALWNGGVKDELVFSALSIADRVCKGPSSGISLHLSPGCSVRWKSEQYQVFHLHSTACSHSCTVLALSCCNFLCSSVVNWANKLISPKNDVSNSNQYCYYGTCL